MAWAVNEDGTEVIVVREEECVVHTHITSDATGIFLGAEPVSLGRTPAWKALFFRLQCN